jgi:hypothetical protein
VSELTDRMRTCAAYIIGHYGDDADHAIRDAAQLLIDASNLLTEKIPVPDLGAAVEITPQSVAKRVEQDLGSQWIAPLGPLPTTASPRSSRACPQCDSRASKRVYRDKNRLMLACPVCGNAWEYRSAAA